MTRRILFITSNRLGDAVLSTGILDHLLGLYPDARVTVACGPLTAGLFQDVPGVERVVAMAKRRYALHWIALWRATFTVRWDIIIDLRNSAVSRLLLAKRRFIWRRPDPALHKVEQNAALLGISPPPAPRLWFSPQTLARARTLLPESNVFTLAIGPTANWKGKTWAPENFIVLIERLRRDVFPNCRVAIFAAPGEEENARRVLASLPSGTGVDIIARADPATAAAAISLCQFYIGNDSGLMHCAAAAGMPTLGLFGPSKPGLYRPWGEKCAFVSTPETMEQLVKAAAGGVNATHSLMGSLTVDAVYDAVTTLKSRL